MNIVIDNLLKHFFYMENHNVCLSKKILYQDIGDFCPAWDSLSSENILHLITQQENLKENIYHQWLCKLGK